MQAAESAYVENSACYVSAAYFDTDGNPFTPSAVSYRVDDLVSGLNIAPMTPVPPASINEVTITSAQNIMINATRDSEQHQALFQITDGFGDVNYERVVFDIIRVTSLD